MGISPARIASGERFGAAVTRGPMMAGDYVQACASEASEWLFESAAPLWSDAGLLADGMFAEALDRFGRPTGKRRRVRVQARQIYSFCEIGRLGWTGPWRAAAGGAVDLLLARGRRDDGFYIHAFDLDGWPSDRRADLYDTAFLIFAFGHAAQALDRPELLVEAEQLAAAVERHWQSPFGGFEEGELESFPRRQNPHMHLLEAMLVQSRVSGGPAWRARAKVLRELALACFIDPASGALLEFFAADLTRLDTPDGKLVEPGHCFEWAWLFEMMGEAGLGDPGPSDRLSRFARAHGLSPRGEVAINSVSLDGSLVDSGARLWPQTERLKAALARWRRTNEEDELVEAAAAWRGLARYFDTPIRGAWRDKLAPGGVFADEPSPASSFYHIVCALSELIETARAL